MRVRYRAASGCSVGHLIIVAENEMDRAVLHGITRYGYENRETHRFGIQSYSGSGDHEGIDEICMGYDKRATEKP